VALLVAGPVFEKSSHGTGPATIPSKHTILANNDKRRIRLVACLGTPE